MSLSQSATNHLRNLTANKTVVIFGLAQEGSSSYRFIRSHLPDLTLTLVDDKPQVELTSDLQTALSADSHASFKLAADFNPDEKELLVIKTPGIPFTHPFFQRLSSKTVTYTSNVQLFFEIISQLPEEERPQTIGITGTKGKSTTTALIHHVLKTASKQVFLAGNIGVPALQILEEMEKLSPEQLFSSYAVLELSSHQLQNLALSPHIAVVQNITPEHLDYYANFEEYVQAKASITKYQTSDDFVIFNPDFMIPAQFAAQSAAQKYPYSVAGTSNAVAGVKNGKFYYKDEIIVSVEDLPLLGEHNLLNALPSVIVAKLAAVSTQDLRQALVSFQSLPHRLEFVAEKQEVRYYNDSQGTTPEAAIAALRSFPGKSIVLLAGGSDKGVAFGELAQEIIKHQVAKLILFPPTGEKIEAAVKEAISSTGDSARQSLNISHVSSMNEAVTQAAQAAQPGSVVLLSPACASFGLFKNYQDRGNQFKAAVAAL